MHPKRKLPNQVFRNARKFRKRKAQMPRDRLLHWRLRIPFLGHANAEMMPQLRASVILPICLSLVLSPSLSPSVMGSQTYGNLGQKDYIDCAQRDYQSLLKDLRQFSWD